MKVNLFKNTEKKYGRDYKNHYIKQYKIFVNSAEKISDRRGTTFSILLAVNSIIIPIILNSFGWTFLKNFWWITIIIPILGILICLIFFRLITSYKQLNTIKFKIIHEMEAKLPLAIYEKEWEYAKEGKSSKIYLQFSKIEPVIIYLFCFFYILSIILIIFFNVFG